MDEGCGVHEADHVSVKLCLDQAERLALWLSAGTSQIGVTDIQSGLEPQIGVEPR
jgi:hypothetical protein